MKIRIAAIAAAALLAVTLTGCGEDTPPQSQPQSFAQSVQETTAADAPASAAPLELTAEDEGYLAEVEKRKPSTGSVLDMFSDAELVTMGHEGCKQIGEGTPIEDLRLVDGEKVTAQGYWRDTSAIFNSALKNYCTDLIQEVP